MTAPPFGTQPDRPTGWVVVVNYGSHGLLAEHLATLDSAALGIRIVVVDNFLSAAEQSAVADLAAAQGWDLVSLADNRGFGGGMNAGVAHAAENGADVVVLLNPDAIITGSVVSELVGACAGQPKLVVGPRILRPDGSIWFQGGRILMDQGRTAAADGTDGTLDHPWLTGACLALTVTFWQQLGGFDDDYFMYWEDIDLSHRATAIGGRLLVRTDLEVIHAVGGTQSSSGRGRSSLYYRFNCRNRLVFAAKRLPPAELRGWLRQTYPYAKEVVLRGGRRQFLRHPLMPVLWATRGSWEGYRIARRRLRELDRGHPTTG